ncbi:MAG: hypothetical protein U0326_24710 [Polyangiales bacterium]
MDTASAVHRGLRLRDERRGTRGDTLTGRCVQCRPGNDALRGERVLRRASALRDGLP